MATSFSLIPSSSIKFIRDSSPSSSSSSSSFFGGGALFFTRSSSNNKSCVSFSSTSQFIKNLYGKRRGGVLVFAAADYYSTLGVPKSATSKDIKAAYRKLARQSNQRSHLPDNITSWQRERKQVSADMAAAAVQALRTQSSVLTIGHQQAIAVENAVHIRKSSFAFGRRAFSPPSADRRFIIAASKSPNEEANSNADDPSLPFTSQDDVNFLLKLGAGSFAAAAAIKYGSILLPEITRPNITQALIMISAPVVVAVLILIKESRVEK